jgi:hypothetical protein
MKALNKSMIADLEQKAADCLNCRFDIDPNDSRKIVFHLRAKVDGASGNMIDSASLQSLVRWMNEHLGVEGHTLWMGIDIDTNRPFLWILK